MAANGHTKFDIPHVLASFKKAGEEMADKVALQIEAQTKVNIQQNGQIDTGFMLNSTYTVSKKRNTYGKTNPNGEYVSQEGDLVKREIAPAVRLPSDALAAVSVGAEYAVYQEVKKPFLYPAVKTVAGQVGGKAQKIFKEALRD